MKNETVEDTLNADDIREKTKVNRHTIFVNMIEDAARMGKSAIAPEWGGMLPRA